MHINIDHDAPSALIQYEDRWNALNRFHGRNQVIYCQFSTFVWIVNTFGKTKDIQCKEKKTVQKSIGFHDMSNIHAYTNCVKELQITKPTNIYYFHYRCNVVCVLNFFRVFSFVWWYVSSSLFCKHSHRKSANIHITAFCFLAIAFYLKLQGTGSISFSKIKWLSVFFCVMW